MDFVEDIKHGAIFIYPTDTIYGLGCDATNEDAVNKIFLIKNKIVLISLFFLCQLSYEFDLAFANHTNDVFLNFDACIQTTYDKNTTIPLLRHNAIELPCNKKTRCGRFAA